MEEFDKYIIKEANSVLDLCKSINKFNERSYSPAIHLCIQTIVAKLALLKDEEGNYLLTKYDNEK